jgi:hypothetical protein
MRPVLSSMVDRAGLSTLSTSLATSLAASQSPSDSTTQLLAATVQLLGAAALMAAYIGIGVLFYSKHERWPIVDAIYFSVVSVSTVGYGDLVPSSTLSRWFTSAYVLGALSTLRWFEPEIRRPAH